jgi:hypothetical protein
VRSLGGDPVLPPLRGEEFFQYALVFVRWSLTRWRQRTAEEKLKALLQESPAVPCILDSR